MLSEEGGRKRRERGVVSNVKPPAGFCSRDDSKSIPFRITTPGQERGGNLAPFRPRGTSDSERYQPVQPLTGHPGGTRCLQTPCTRLRNRVKPLLKRLAPVRITPVVHVYRNRPGFGSVGMIQSGAVLPTKVNRRTGDSPIWGFTSYQTKPFAFACKLSPSQLYPRVSRHLPQITWLEHFTATRNRGGFP